MALAAAERIDAQPRIVGKRRKVRRAACVPRFPESVFKVRRVRLVCLGDAELFDFGSHAVIVQERNLRSRLRREWSCEQLLHIFLLRAWRARAGMPCCCCAPQGTSIDGRRSASSWQAAENFYKLNTIRDVRCIIRDA